MVLQKRAGPLREPIHCECNENGPRSGPCTNRSDQSAISRPRKRRPDLCEGDGWGRHLAHSPERKSPEPGVGH